VGTKTGRPTAISTAEGMANALTSVLDVVKLPGFLGVETAGSVRRRNPVVSDVDLVVWAEIDDLTVWNEPWQKSCPQVPIRWTPKGAAGDWKDVRIEFYKAPTVLDVGATMLFTTGPASLNVYMRQQAIKRGWKLSQYGLLRQDGMRVDTPTGDWPEDELMLFDALEMPRMTAQQRETWRQHVAEANRS
jgi:DNA polymerase/3'-5' exonuclease PolX